MKKQIMWFDGVDCGFVGSRGSVETSEEWAEIFNNEEEALEFLDRYCSDWQSELKIVDREEN